MLVILPTLSPVGLFHTMLDRETKMFRCIFEVHVYGYIHSTMELTLSCLTLTCMCFFHM